VIDIWIEHVYRRLSGWAGAERPKDPMHMFCGFFAHGSTNAEHYLYQENKPMNLGMSLIIIIN
jgi:hypothetical protein